MSSIWLDGSYLLTGGSLLHHNLKNNSTSSSNGFLDKKDGSKFNDEFN
jgi:hypothetical protein